MKISHQELAGWNPAPGTPGDALYQIAGGVKDFACSIWNRFPYEYVPNNPVTSPIKYLWNANCAMPPTSQPPVVTPPPPFQGGQCNFGYQLFMRFDRTQLFAGQCQNVQDPSTGSPLQVFATVWGPVQSVFLSQPKSATCGNGFSGFSIVCHGDYAGARQANPVTVVKQLTNPIGETLYTNIAELVVTPVGGVPDTCGNPPAVFPPGNPPSSETFNVTVNDNDTTIDIPVTWNGDVNIPITFNAGGVNITFDFGGIDFSWNGDINIGGNGANPFPEKPPVTIGPGTNSPGGGGTNPSPGEPFVIQKPPIIVEPPTPLDEPPPPGEEIIYVEITVLSIFNDIKNAIINVNPSDSVYFAGYVAWTIEGAPLATIAPEIPIRRQRNLFRKPDEFDGFKVRAINGASLSVTTFTVIKNPANNG